MCLCKKRKRSGKKVAVCKSERELSSESYLARPWSGTSSLQNCEKKKFLLLKPVVLSVVFCYGSLSRLTQSRKHSRDRPRGAFHPDWSQTNPLKYFLGKVQILGEFFKKQIMWALILFLVMLSYFFFFLQNIGKCQLFRCSSNFIGNNYWISPLRSTLKCSESILIIFTTLSIHLALL